jgi:tetratricopeptide (TPR) repeat protein
MNDPIYNNQELLNEISANENQDEVANIKNAINEFNNGNYDKCIEYCTNEVDQNGRYQNEVLNLRGSLFMLRCQFDESIKDFNKLLNNDSASNRVCFLFKFFILFSMIFLFCKVKSNTLIKMTALNLQRNEEYEAFINYDKAISIDQNNEDIYCNRAQVNFCYP